MYQVPAEGVYVAKPKVYTEYQCKPSEAEGMYQISTEGVYVAKPKVYNEYQLKVCTWRSRKCTRRWSAAAVVHRKR